MKARPMFAPAAVHSEHRFGNGGDVERCGVCESEIPFRGGQAGYREFLDLNVLVCAACWERWPSAYAAAHLDKVAEAAGIPAVYRTATVEQVPAAVRAVLTPWTGAPTFVLLYGAVGTGKSCAAAVKARAMLADGQAVKWVSTSRLLEAMRANLDGAAAIMCDLVTAPLLVLDDFASERATEWTTDRLALLVSSRWDDERPTVVTTNVGPVALAEWHPRAASRLLSGLVLQLAGRDRRLERKP